jgi:hypothetical protein
MLANKPFHVAGPIADGEERKAREPRKKSAAKIVFHGISHFPAVIVISPEQIVLQRGSRAMK